MSKWDNVLFVATNIDWDAEPDVTLPVSIKIPAVKLLFAGDDAENIDEETLKDRIPDWISDNYGFCISSLAIDTESNAKPNWRAALKLLLLSDIKATTLNAVKNGIQEYMLRNEEQMMFDEAEEVWEMYDLIDGVVR